MNALPSALFSTPGLVLLSASAFVFLVVLSLRGSHAVPFYLMAVSGVALWMANAPPSNFSNLQSWLSSVLQVFGFSAQTSLTLYVYYLSLLVIVTAPFYTAPRKARELGFISFGLLFGSPMFRRYVYLPTYSIVAIALFLVVLAIVVSVTLSTNRWKAVLQVLFLSLSTSLLTTFSWVFILVPLLYVIAFPGRRSSYLYFPLTLLISLFLMRLGFHWNLTVVPHGSLPKFLFQNVLSLLLIGVGLVRARREVSKGPTAFLIVLSFFLFLAALIDRSLLPFLQVSLAVLAVRSINL